MNTSRRINPRGSPCHGMTLVEMMVTMVIFGLAITAFMYAYMFGLREDQLAQSKMGASEESRRSFERVARDIREANSHAVGNYDGTNFTAIVNGNDLVGNAVQIVLTATNIYVPTNYNNYIIYYFNTNSANGTWTLNRIHSGGAGSTVIASHLQNSGTFTTEDFFGRVQQNMQNKDVIHFMLDFREYQYPLTLVGNQYLYDRYVLDFRAAPHVPGGK